MIDASYDTLMRQASMTACDYMIHAVEDIDRIFGEGYAAKNPELVAAYINTAAIDFASNVISKTISETFR